MKALSVRLDDRLGREFDEVCRRTGYKKNTLLTRLIASFVRHQKGLVGGSRREKDPFLGAIGLMAIEPLLGASDLNGAIDRVVYGL